MLDITTSRRDFISAGSLTLAGLGLSNLPLEAAAQDKKNEKSVILLFLAGGMTQAESFVAAPNAMDGFRSVNGYVDTKSGFKLGSLWQKLAGVSDTYSVLHNFAHINPDHSRATHYVATGYNTPDETQKNPSIGSLAGRHYGTNNKDGMPTYVATQNMFANKAAYLGSSYNPFSLDGKGIVDLKLGISEERFRARMWYLSQMDKSFNGKVDKAIELYKKQGYDILLGKVREAFETNRESQAVQNMYGDSRLAKDLLLARRLVQHGVKVVSVVHGGWDMHTGIANGLNKLVPETDHAISTLLTDLQTNGMLDNTLVIVATEFGRTKINANAGRDHYPRMVPLLLGGGNYQGGKVIGECDKNGFEPKGNAFGPIDLLASAVSHLGIPPTSQNFDNSGRPRYIVEGKHSIIS